MAPNNPNSNHRLRRINGGLENAMVIKVLKKYRKNPCLWDTADQFYHNKPVKTAAWESLLRIWRQLQPRATLHEVKIKIFHMRTNYTRQRRKVSVFFYFITNFRKKHYINFYEETIFSPYLYMVAT